MAIKLAEREVRPPMASAAFLKPFRVVEDAAGPGVAFPRIAMTLGAPLRGDHRIFGFKSAGPALHLENCNLHSLSLIRVIRGKMAFRGEWFHTNRHDNSP
jgi:hypothetical protein